MIQPTSIVSRRQIERKKDTQLKGGRRTRNAAVERGEPDPTPGQPLDDETWLMVPLIGDSPDDLRRGTMIVAMNGLSPARGILYQTHAIATLEEIRAGEEFDRAEHAKHIAADARTQQRRVVTVEPLSPIKVK